jgi:hypothetical protein
MHRHVGVIAEAQPAGTASACWGRCGGRLACLPRERFYRVLLAAEVRSSARDSSSSTRTTSLRPKLRRPCRVSPCSLAGGTTRPGSDCAWDASGRVNPVHQRIVKVAAGRHPHFSRVWAANGQQRSCSPRPAPTRKSPENDETPAYAGVSCNRGARIRTGDLTDPNGARYQAAPRPEGDECIPPGRRKCEAPGGNRGLRLRRRRGGCSSGQPSPLSTDRGQNLSDLCKFSPRCAGPA